MNEKELLLTWLRSEAKHSAREAGRLASQWLDDDASQWLTRAAAFLDVIRYVESHLDPASPDKETTSASHP